MSDYFLRDFFMGVAFGIATSFLTYEVFFSERIIQDKNFRNTSCFATTEKYTERKFCPFCKTLNQTSEVYRDSCSLTSMWCGDGYWDENGAYHPPENCNKMTCHYYCNKGHEWSEEEQN